MELVCLIWLSVKFKWPIWLIVNHNGHWLTWLNLSHLDGPLTFLTRCFIYHMVKKVTLVKCFNKNNLYLSCPRPLVKMAIPFGQCGHFNQVGPFEKSHFLVLIYRFNLSLILGWLFKFSLSLTLSLT